MCDRGCPACGSFAFGQLWLPSLFRNCSSPRENRRCSFSSPLRPGLCPAVSIHTNCYLCTRPDLQDFPRVSNQLRDLARVLRCGLPPLVLQAIPASAVSRLRRVNCCLPLWFCKALPAKPCQAFFKGVGRTRALAHLYNN